MSLSDQLEDHARTLIDKEKNDALGPLGQTVDKTLGKWQSRKHFLKLLSLEK